MSKDIQESIFKLLENTPRAFILGVRNEDGTMQFLTNGQTPEQLLLVKMIGLSVDQEALKLLNRK